MWTTPTLRKVSQVSLIQFTTYTFRIKLCSASGTLTPQTALPLLKQLLVLTMVSSSYYQQPLHRKFSLPCPVSVRKLSLAGLASLRLDMNQGFQSSAKYMHVLPGVLNSLPQPCPGRKSFWGAYCSSTTTRKSPLRRFPPSDYTLLSILITITSLTLLSHHSLLFS